MANKTSLSERDSRIEYIDVQLTRNIILLKKRYNDIKIKIKNTNHKYTKSEIYFLKIIKESYNKYYINIINNKKSQIGILKQICNSNKNNKDYLKNDNQYINNEIEHIQNEINNINQNI
jgi:hypothetical protein